LGAKTEEQGHQRVFDHMERDSSRGRYLGERAGVAAPWTGIALGQAISGREDCNVPSQLGALERRLGSSLDSDGGINWGAFSRLGRATLLAGTFGVLERASSHIHGNPSDPFPSRPRQSF
jgi:hypothetical protein